MPTARVGEIRCPDVDMAGVDVRTAPVVRSVPAGHRDVADPYRAGRREAISEPLLPDPPPPRQWVDATERSRVTDSVPQGRVDYVLGQSGCPGIGGVVVEWSQSWKKPSRCRPDTRSATSM